MKHLQSLLYGVALLGASILIFGMSMTVYTTVMEVYDIEGYIAIPMFAMIGGLLNMLFRWMDDESTL